MASHSNKDQSLQNNDVIAKRAVEDLIGNAVVTDTMLVHK
jgi:hypothetical protein